MDRKAEPGDLVYVDQKRGEVISVSWSCYVRILENKMCLLDLPCERLEPLVPHYPGQRLEVDGWIGTVTSVSTEATLLFSKTRDLTGVVNCNDLPPDKLPLYPGKRVNYTFEQYKNAGLKLLDDYPIQDLFGLDDSLEAFVLFVNIAQVDVKWDGKVAPKTDSSVMPAKTLTRGFVKKRVRVLGTSADIQWDSLQDGMDRLYKCSVHPDDLIIADSREDMVEDYLLKKYYDYDAEIENPSKTVAGMLGDDRNVMMNVPYPVRILRFTRILHVKWFSVSDKYKISTFGW